MINGSSLHNSHDWFHNFPHRYQEKKACGKIVQVSVKSVSPATRKQLREKWRESMRRCLERLRAIKVVPDLTPQSDQDHDLSFNYDNEAAAEVPVDLPTQSRPKRKKIICDEGTKEAKKAK